MKKELLKIGIVGLLFALAFSVNAQQKETITSSSPDSLYLHDNFDIKGATLGDGTNGISGFGWANSWSYASGASAPMLINETGSLSYPTASDIFVSGGHIEKYSGSENIIERSLTNTYELLNSTFYLSFLVQKDASGYFSLEGYGGSYMRYGLRVGASGIVEVRASTSWGTGSSTGTFANDKTYLVVIAKDGGDSKVALFEEGDDIPTDVNNISWVATSSGVSGVDLDKFRFIVSSENVKIDEFRLGSTLRSVTQETNNSATVYERNPKIEWGAEAGLDYYNIQLSTISDFSTIAFNDTISTIVSGFVPLDQLNYTDYYWRIRGRNKTSKSWGVWRSTRTLTVSENTVIQVNLTDNFATIRLKVNNCSSNQKIVFEQGTYSFDAADVGATDYMLKINSKNNVEVDGNGSTIVFESDVSNIGLLSADRSTNITLRNLKVQRDKKLHLPLKILSVNTSEKSFICERVNSNYPLPADDDTQYDMSINTGWVLDGETLKPKHGTLLSVLIDPNNSGVYQTTQWKYYLDPAATDRHYVINNLAAGDIFLSGQKYGNNKEVSLTNCYNVTIYDYDAINTGNTFNFYAYKCGDVKVLKCDFPRDVYQGPVSDGMHFKDHRRGVWIEANTIEYNGDDAIAIRPANHAVTYINSSSFTVSQYDDIEVGDRLHFVNGSAFSYLYEANVASITDNGSTQTITLDAAVLTTSGTNYNNYSLAAPGSMIRGNSLKGNRGDAFHICMDGAVFENNTVNDLGERVFTITPSEGGGTYSGNLLIRNNKFVNCKRWNDVDDADGTFMSIKFGSSSLKKHHNITFENNKCFGFPNTALSIENTDGVYIKNNLFSSGENIDTNIDQACDVILVDNTANVFFEGNKFIDFRNRSAADNSTITNSSDFTTNNPNFDNQFISKTWSVDEINHTNAGIFNRGKAIPSRSLSYFSLVGEGEIDGNYITDKLTYANVPVEDNCLLKMKMDTLIVPSTTNFARAGLMMRESTATGAKYAMMSVREYNGNFYMQYISRSADNTKLSVGATSGIITFPIYIKLVREGNNFASYYSSDDIIWTEIYSHSLSLNSSLIAGVAITSQASGVTSTVRGDELLIDDNDFTNSLFKSNTISKSTTAEDETYEIIDDNKTAINVYPNPASKQFTVALNARENVILNLYDVNGKIVFTKKNASDKVVISTNTLKTGIYFLKVIDSKEMQIKKVMVNP